MSLSEDEFLRVGQSISNSELSQMFGKPCFKTGGKAFVAYFQEAMVFKITGDHHAAAIALEGARLFDPSGKGRAMKEWVQVPFNHKGRWPEFAMAAFVYVAG